LTWPAAGREDFNVSDTPPHLIHDLLGLRTGSLTLAAIDVARWGSRITVDCLYRYPPEEKRFRLVFEGCRGIEWSVARPDIGEGESAQVLTHDLGAAHYQRPARLATVLAEIIITYEALSVEKDW
jgi:hypothetical protein